MRIATWWSRALAAVADRLPLLGRLSPALREWLVGGAFLSGAVLLLLGGALGVLNRGPAGLLIGAASGGVAGAAGGAALAASLAWWRGRHPQLGTATLTIELDEPNARYDPGATVFGRLLVSATHTIALRGGRVYLLCRGLRVYDLPGANGSRQPQFNRQAHEYWLQHSDAFPARLVRPERRECYPFRFTLPDQALPTHHGYIYSVLWSLHAVMQAADGRVLHAEQELLIEAVPPLLAVGPGELVSRAPSQACQMFLTIPKVVYAEGELLEGEVRIIPSEPIDAQEIRAVLLRIENTAAGDDHYVYVTQWDPESGLFRGERRAGGHGTTYVWLEGEALLSGPVRLPAGQSVRHRFSLRIPGEWRPTLDTGDGRVTWKLGVVLARETDRDVRAFHEVIVHTAAPQARPRVGLRRRT